MDNAALITLGESVEPLNWANAEGDEHEGEQSGEQTGDGDEPRVNHLVALIDTGVPEGDPNVEAAWSVLPAGPGTGSDAEGEGAGDSASGAGGSAGAGATAAGSPWDDSGHGTAMLEAMRGENAGVRVLSVKALDSHGRGTAASVMAAIQLARESGAEIVNLSLSGPANEGNVAIARPIREAASEGVIVVAAAGNAGADASGYVPAGVYEAYVVGAADRAKLDAGLEGEAARLASSNFGPTVDAYVAASSTSEAAARESGRLSALGAGELAGESGALCVPGPGGAPAPQGGGGLQIMDWGRSDYYKYKYTVEWEAFTYKILPGEGKTIDAQTSWSAGAQIMDVNFAKIEVVNNIPMGWTQQVAGGMATGDWISWDEVGLEFYLGEWCEAQPGVFGKSNPFRLEIWGTSYPDVHETRTVIDGEGTIKYRVTRLTQGPSYTPVSPPSGTTSVYDGQKHTLPSGTGYTVSGEAGPGAGTYNLTASLTDKTNYKWSDGTTADKTITWVIKPYFHAPGPQRGPDLGLPLPGRPRGGKPVRQGRAPRAPQPARPPREPAPELGGRRLPAGRPGGQAGGQAAAWRPRGGGEAPAAGARPRRLGPLCGHLGTARVVG